MSGIDPVLQAAQSMLGTRYVWGGTNPTNGVDCSGFVQQAYAAAGVNLPRVSNAQAQSGMAITREEAQPGDLVWWDLNGRNEGADHIGIYIGDGKVIEASSSRGEVVVRNLWGQAHFTRPTGAPTGAPTAATGSQQVAPKVKQRPAMSSAELTTYDPGNILDPTGTDSTFDVTALYDAVDPDDPGETPETVGPDAVARLMIDGAQQVVKAMGKRKAVT